MRGSIFWMAPEVISSASYSGKIDIWSLGCVVLEMWSGQRPWGTFEPFAAMFCLFQQRSPPPLPQEIHLNPIANEFLYTLCLAADARDRPTALELAKHTFITQRDPSWTFARSPIGRAVAKRGNKNMRSASSSTATAVSSGVVQTSTSTTGGTLIPVVGGK
jgi:mitogen-activated protein kinase kinase kinase